jgi:hypothetical protein
MMDRVQWVIDYLRWMEMWEATQAIEQLQQCHREGWRYAREVEDEYTKRTGETFANKNLNIKSEP